MESLHDKHLPNDAGNAIHATVYEPPLEGAGVGHMPMTIGSQTMPTPLVPAQQGRCQAERCDRTPCFRVEVHDPPGTIVDGKTADTCADHLGATVQDLNHWAVTAELDAGRIQVCVIDGRPGCVESLPEGALLPASWPFASIPLI